MAPIVDVTSAPVTACVAATCWSTLERASLQANGAARRRGRPPPSRTNAAEADVRATESALQLAQRDARPDRGRLQVERSATAQELDQAVAALSAADAQRAAAQVPSGRSTAGRDAANAAAAATDGHGDLCDADRAVRRRRRRAQRRTRLHGHARHAAAHRRGSDDVSTAKSTLDESRAAHIAAAVEVTVRSDADGRQRGRGNRRVDPVSHNFLVKMDLRGSAVGPVYSAARVHAESAARSRPFLPRACQRGQLTFVFVADADRLVQLRPVVDGRNGWRPRRSAGRPARGRSRRRAPARRCATATPWLRCAP